MKNTMKKLAMLLCVATIATGAISCESKAKKEAKEAAKQELLLKQQEEARREEARQEEVREREKHNEFIKLYTDKMYNEGRSEGYNCGGTFESYRKEEWRKKRLSAAKSVWIASGNLTTEEMNALENVFNKGFDEGWTMAQSDK